MYQDYHYLIGDVLMKYRENFFEIFCLSCLFLYTLFYFTPSSYSIALDLIGVEHKVFYGTPRGIRSDEWAVWTPYFQAVVNNDFGRFDESSIYNIDFRNFYSLPVLDWGLLFKPFMWPFFIFEPDRAFSLYNGLVIFSMVVGFKILFKKLFYSTGLKGNTAYVLFSLLLYYSSFSQMWLTTIGPLLAMSPWLILCILSWKGNDIKYYLLLFYTATCWMISHAYPPIIISVAYFGLLLILVFQRSFFLDKSRVVFTFLTCIASCIVVYVYFVDIINVMMDTTYPGRRVAEGGSVSLILWLSTIVPYIVQSGYNDLIYQNICEVSSASSLLPVIALFFLNYKSDNSFGLKNYLLYLLSFLFFSSWMLLDMPSLFGKLSLLSLVPPQRLLWVSGLTFNLFSLHLLLIKGTSITYRRILFFSIFIILASHIPSFMGYIGMFEKTLWELLSIPLICILYFTTKTKYKEHQAIGLLAVCLLINLLYTFSFNPIQSSKSIFSAIDSEQVSYLKEFENSSDENMTVIAGYPGAILYGLGLNSFTNVLMKPDLDYFRTLYPDMPEASFQYIFNRYAHIHLYEGDHPRVPQADLIYVPYSDAKDTKFRKVDIKKIDFLETNDKGSIDSVVLEGSNLKVNGWSYREASDPLYINLDARTANFASLVRGDVVKALNRKDLIYSGFHLSIELTEKGLFDYKENGFCLMFDSDKFGTSKLTYNVSNDINSCHTVDNEWIEIR